MDKENPEVKFATPKTTKTAFLEALKVCLNITVEPVMFFLLFVFSLCSITNLTLTMQLVCSAEKNFSDEVCKNFMTDNKYQQQKIDIQKSANNWTLINSVVSAIPVVIISLFAGPWSDKYGRRLPLIAPISGGAVTSVLLIIISYTNYNYSPYAVIIANIPTAISGSFVSFLIGMSYLADVTTHEYRSIKFIFAEGLILLGIPAGTLSAGYIYKSFSFGIVYIVALVCQVIALLYGIVILKETRGIGNEDSFKCRVKYFFSLKPFKESFKSCFRMRAGNNRMLVIFLLISMLCFIFYKHLQAGICFLYTQLKFDWNEWKYTVFQSSTNFSALALSIVVAPFLTYIFKLSDTILGIFGAVSAILSVLIMGVAPNTLLFYIGGFVGIFQTVVPPLIRSSLTKIVDEDEIGKIFAFVTSLEFGTPALSSLFYTELYNHTVHSFPSCCFFIAGLIFVWPLITFAILGNSNPSNLRGYQKIEGDNEENTIQ